MNDPNRKSESPLWAKIVGTALAVPVVLIVIGVLVLGVQWVWSAVLR